MLIVAIAWAYFVLMLAVTSDSFGKGLMVTVFLGILPLWLFVYAAGSKRRQRSIADEMPDPPDRENAQADQD